MRTIFTNAVFAIASIGFTAVAVAASTPAAAANTDATLRAVVQTADLDLGSADGHRVATRRIDAAAARLCDITPGDPLATASCRARTAAAAQQALARMSGPQQLAAR